MMKIILNIRDIISALRLPRECADKQLSASGVHTIYPYGRLQQPVSVYCYVDSSMHSWTVSFYFYI